MSEKKNICIIGAGPAGLSAAYKLSENSDVSVTVFESEDRVGGMCKSIKLWDCTVDIGPHRFFSYDNRVNSFWIEVVGKDYKMVDRLTRIFYKKKFFSYPIQAFDALKKVGFFTAVACFFSYLWQKVRPVKQDGSFESWVSLRFGKKLYTMFFKTYSEKLWGIPCTELDDDFASQRIKKLSMMEVVLNALKLKKNSHKTLVVDKFAYPIGGTGRVYEKMAIKIEERGGKICCSTPVSKIIVKNGEAKGIVLQNGEELEFDEIISTMPFTDVISQIPDLPVQVKDSLGRLRYRNTIMVFLKVESTNLFKDNWLYVHSTDLEMGRVTNFRNWIPELYGKEDCSILALEYWCYDEDEFWNKSSEEYIKLAKEEICKAGLVNDEPITDGFAYKIHRSYPTYHKGYKKDLKPIEDFAESIKNLQCIGRYGAFKYNNQDHSILMGLMAAENVMEEGKNNLWNVNTDYDSYQESSLITDTGLEIKN